MNTQQSSFLEKIKIGNLADTLIRHGDLLVALGMVGLITTIIVQIPTWLISILLLLNLTISLGVLLVSLYLSSPLQLSSYPSILLLTTLFRLCLSLSCTRSILISGEAGDVIKLLGQTTASGNIIVGAVMFIMLLVVQFLVIAKGAERVAEVGARFTLDAMPGKQMSIDADMRAGLISQEEGRKLRSELQKESKLYGAMDGAMKFVKGDSIATIIIALVNIVAGLSIGVLQHGLTMADAARKYTILTIGDGLGAIFGSIFIAISAGLVVTRVTSNDETNVGADISAQLLSHKKPLIIVTGLLFTLLFVGMPIIPVLIVGGLVGSIAYGINKSQKEAKVEQEEQLQIQAGKEAEEGDDLQPSPTVSMSVVVSYELTHLVDLKTEAGVQLRNQLKEMRSTIYYDTGVLMPSVYIMGEAPIAANQYVVAVKETPIAVGYINPGCFFVNDSIENIEVFGLQGENIRNPADMRPGAWVWEEQREIAEQTGLKIWNPPDFLLLHLSNIMKKHLHEFFGIQEAQALLDFLVATGLPKLVEEVVPKILSINQFTEVLQRLIQEGVSIRDIKSILNTLSEWGRVEKDTVMLTEYVRASLKRSISFKLTEGRDTIFVHMLDPEIEDVIRSAIRRTSTGSFLALDPSISQDILEALEREIGHAPPTAQKPVIITDMELRRFIRKIVELEFPMLAVLSYQEISPELNVQPISRISIRAANTTTTNQY